MSTEMKNIVNTLPRAWLICIIFASVARGNDRFKSLDGYITEAMEKWQVPGLAIAVVKDGEIVLSRGYGNRRLDSNTPVTADTVFPIASCTKSFTAACIAILVDEGKLNWNDPVRQYLPSFQVADPYVSKHVTIRDLLCHRTGLVRGDLVGMSGGFTHEKMLDQIQFLPQAAPFRTKMTYSGLMYTVLGEIVKEKSGVSWQEFVRSRLFEPLQMKSTTAGRKSIAADQAAVRHRLYDGETAPLRTPNSDIMAPGGAIHSTVNDMAQWLKLQLQSGEYNERQLITKESIREMHSLHQSIPVQWRPDSDVYDARFVGTGLGWFVRDYRGRKVVQHGGAWGAEVAFVPEEDLGVVLLSNRDLNGLVWMLIFDVIDAYVAGPDRAWAKGKKWEHWLPIGGPEGMDRERRHQLAQLSKDRKPGTKLSLPLTEYAGTYKSTLYSNLELTVADDRLHVRFGDYTATLEHWDRDSFYGRAVIEPWLDWYLVFDLDEEKAIRGLEIIHIGWKDPDERFVFKRVVNKKAVK